MSLISAFPGGGAEIEGNALPANVEKGVTFMSANSDEVQTGTKVPQGTATPSDVVSGKTFQSAASEGLQTGTRSSGTYRVYTSSTSVPNDGEAYSGTINVGFRPVYLYVAYHWSNVAGGYMVAYWNGSILQSDSTNVLGFSVSTTSTGFTYSLSSTVGASRPTYLYYVAIG